MDHVKNRATACRKIEAVGLKFIDHATTAISLEEAKLLQVLLRNAWNRVEETHASAISTCTTEAATEAHAVLYEAAFERYGQIELQSTVIIRDLEIAAAAVVGAVPVIPAVSNVRLPAMELPSFDGALHEWTSFKDLFLATMGNNTQLSGSQKLQYLKTSLRGKAAEQISTLAITDAHYTEAWSILCNKYENTREIVHSLIRRIIDFKALNRENAADIQGLMDNTLKCIRALKVIGRPVAEWDDILIVILTSKLDPTTRREWAIRQTGRNLPTMKEFEDFLHGHVRGLLAAGSIPLAFQQQPLPKARFEKGVRVHHSSADTSSSCPVCTKPHTVHSCRERQSKSPAERSSIIRRIQLCFNCLSASHRFKECPSSGSCRQCGQRHHTLLHVSRPSGVPENNGTFASKAITSRGSPASHRQTDSPPVVGSHHASGDESGLLMTAVVEVKDPLGRSHQCRVFIDSGSQSDFVTTSFVRRLGLPRRHCNIGIGGIGGAAAGRSKGKVTVNLVSRYNPQSSLEVTLLVLDKLTDLLPNVRCKKASWRHLQGLQFADPQWHHPAPVDVLLGVKHEAYIKLEKKILGSSPREPVAWETIFGWGISGACPADTTTVNTFHVSIDIVDTFIKKFWEIEEPPKKKILTLDEKKCEEHFQRTHSRDPHGRFVVAIPFNEKKKQLGNSRMIAINRFKQVERRLLKQPYFREQYVSFMRDNEALGHMVKVPTINPPSCSLYLCHHGVLNDSSTTTKLRVVFDGSAATSTGVSLNDAMLVGATLQDDLIDILLRFRIHKVVLKGDIAKMFRQFYLREEDADYHRIIWREKPEDELQDYRLQTVTYGTACAPNLATRCLQQLAQDVKTKFPAASKALHDDAYVDDILTGGDSEGEVMKIYKELVSSVATAGMELRKWSSNSQTILNAIPHEFRETDPVNFDNDDQLVKALGIQWNPAMDTFTFKPIKFQKGRPLTKRMLYSELARVFDPLGFISCVTVRGKLLLQKLWTLQIGWDVEVPESIRLLWMEYKDDLQLLSSVHLLRQISLSPEFTELHCFSDSSERAYGSVLYARSVYPDGTITLSFITSKAKVAPLKPVSLPRMELNAAKGGAELATHVREVLLPSMKVSSTNSTPLDLIMWTDSTITLKWITGEPRRWKTYVANRVAAIQEITTKKCWRHVAGKDNPADLASRGIPLAELGDFWWNGPSWLLSPTLPEFSTPPSSTTADEEEREVTTTCHAVSVTEDWMDRHSSLRLLKRVAALLHRFLFSQRKVQGSLERVSTSGPTSVKTLTFTPTDIANGLKLLIRFTQQRYFNAEIQSLKKTKEVHTSSSLKSLYPYIDKEGILRVSGRFQNTSMKEERKHLVILPGESHLTKLLVRDTHHRHHHAGFQFTWGQLGLEFWIVRGRDRVRHILRSCVTCRRHRAKAAEQLMGQLPACRATPSRPFLNSGVDYAGPFSVKSQSGRGWKVVKSWLCLFVCMASKAIHLELVDSLSTESFLAAFRRFSSRRGIPSHIYSDCGTNFIGAEKELQQYLVQEETNAFMAKKLSERGITWHFLSPNAPHQGGLWEAGVKSAKHHLRRVVGDLTLTKECFTTLLCEIEAILNSRPLYQRSTDPADMEPLTPGHLLIGEPLTAVPSPSLLEIRQNRLSQYQLVINRVQEFWRRWSLEYLNTMQQRTKWMWQKDNVKLGDLVLLVEESPPTLWRMGRVEAVHPGEDGLVRNVTVKTATSSSGDP